VVPGQVPVVAVPMIPPQEVSTIAAKQSRLERIVRVTSVPSVIVSEYQSVSRVPPLAQNSPPTVAPMAIGSVGLPPAALLQPPLRS